MEAFQVPLLDIPVVKHPKEMSGQDNVEPSFIKANEGQPIQTSFLTGEEARCPGLSMCGAVWLNQTLLNKYLTLHGVNRQILGTESAES